MSNSGYSRIIDNVVIDVPRKEKKVIIYEINTSDEFEIYSKAVFEDLNDFESWIEDIRKEEIVSENEDHEYLFDIQVNDKDIRIKKTSYGSFIENLQRAKGKLQKNLNLH